MIKPNEYLGELCVRKHEWNGTDKSLRLKKTYDCIICHRTRSNEYFHQYKKKESKTRKEWKANNKEKVLEMATKYSRLHRKSNNNRSRRYRKELKDHYIMTLLRQEGRGIPDNLLNMLIKIKRLHLKNLRLLKERSIANG